MVRLDARVSLCCERKRFVAPLVCPVGKEMCYWRDTVDERFYMCMYMGEVRGQVVDCLYSIKEVRDGSEDSGIAG